MKPNISARDLARRQKDLDGFNEKYQALIDARLIEYGKEILPTWKRIGRNATDELKAIYNKVQDANGVPITKQPIRKDKLENMKRRGGHLASIQAQLVGMMGTREQAEKLTNNLAYSYAHSYYYGAWGTEQAARVTINVPILTESHVMGVIANPWLPDGKTYSDRIRANTVFLAGKMKDSLEEALGGGWDINRLARRIQEVAGEGFHNSVRLARTEMNRAASVGTSHLYMQNADILDGKRWNAVLDAKTAPKDAANDGKIYELDYDTEENPGEPGERIPNHPNCRCKYSPVLSALGVSNRERIARGDGATVQQFGDRIYTKARTFREYAKQRGLPDLNERLRYDDPRRYLRRGEKTTAPIPKKPSNKREYKEINGYKAKIHKGSQEKHIPGTSNYKQELANGKYKSIVYGSVEELQKLLDEFAGTGEFLPKRPNVERVTFSRAIGEFFDANGTKMYYVTNKGMIHYSKNRGAHIVPARPDELKGGKSIEERLN